METLKQWPPNAPACLARLGLLRHLIIGFTTHSWLRICNNFNGRWHLSNSCVSHRSARDMSCFAADEGGTGSCCKSANYIETVQVTRLLFRSPLIRWGQILSCERVCGREKRGARIRPELFWIWIHQIPSVNFEEHVISNGHFESILFNEGVSISWIYFIWNKIFFSVENQKYWAMIKLDMRLLYDLLIN